MVSLLPHLIADFMFLFKKPFWTYWVSNFPGAGDVWFSLNGTTYQNNSLVTLEDIGGNDTALLCMTNFTDCCRRTGGTEFALGSWIFPNKTPVASSGYQWDFHRTRGPMVVLLHRRRGGEEGIYRCEIPDSMNVTQTIYIGVYNTTSGEWHSLNTPGHSLWKSQQYVQQYVQSTSLDCC